MFLILGTSECKFCLESKKLLDDTGLEYTYVDLGLKLNDWRSIFTTLKSILNTQRTIPIILQDKNGAEKCRTIVPTMTSTPTPVPEDLTVESLHQSGWTLLGSFFDLEELVNELRDNESIDISDNY